MSSEPAKTDLPVSGQQGTPEDAKAALQEFEKLVASLAAPTYVFQLYVAGTSRRSSMAIANVRSICEQYLPGRYRLDVIDVYQQPAATKQAEVIAVPTLIKEFPLPTKKFVGDMSNSERIVVGLKLRD